METGPRYRFKVYYNEVDVHQLKDENSQLRGEKIKLEESLLQEKAKRLRVDKKSREALEKAEKKGPSKITNLLSWPKTDYKWEKR